MIVREGFLHTFITGNLKYEKTPDKIYSEQPEVKKKIEELQKKAKEKSDKNTTYYVRVDSKNKTVTLESSPTTKSLGYHAWNDVSRKSSRSGKADMDRSSNKRSPKET